MLEMAQVNFFLRSELIRYVSKKFTDLNRIEILICNNTGFFMILFSNVGSVMFIFISFLCNCLFSTFVY